LKLKEFGGGLFFLEEPASITWCTTFKFSIFKIVYRCLKS